MSFNMSDGEINWHAEFSDFSIINAHDKDVDTGDIYICGHYQPNEATDSDKAEGSEIRYKAVIAKVQNDGEVYWQRTISGINQDLSIERASED